MDLGLSDRVYVVTGASRGLGRACAEQLAAEGARLVLSGRDEDALRATAAALGGSERAIAVSGDLSEPGIETCLVAAAIARYGRLDGALISVGGPPPGTRDGHRRRRLAAGLRERLPRPAAAGPRGRRQRVPRGRLDRAGALDVGARADRGPGPVERPAPGPGDDRQDPRRRARPAQRPGERRSCPAASTPSARAPRTPPAAAPRRSAARTRPPSRCAATASRSSSPAPPSSCSPPPRAT